MLINPNLYNGPSRVFVPKHSLAINLDELNLVDGETYIISIINRQGAGGSGMFDINIHDNTSYVMGTRVKKDIRQSYSFKYKANVGYEIRLFNDIWGKHDEVSATYLKIKLEEGDKATPYIPHENSIETAKRQYFIGGGYFKEVYPI